MHFPTCGWRPPCARQGRSLRIAATLKSVRHAALCLAIASQTAIADNPEWQTWLHRQVDQQPNVQAAYQEYQAERASADALSQPLYNPSLAAEFERVGADNSYLIGLEQTLDVWNSRAARKAQARFVRQAANGNLEHARQTATAETLSALVNWAAAEQTTDLARQQEAQLNRLLQLISQRQAAGDVAEVDAHLAYLSLSERLLALADANGDLQARRAQVVELLPSWSESEGGIPADVWPSSPAPAETAEIRQHPAVQAMHGQWQRLQHLAEATVRGNRAAPTLGLGAGREGDENRIALSFAMPLQIRNGQGAENRSARQRALEAEARFHGAYRRQQRLAQTAFAQWQAYHEQWRRWQRLTEDRIERSNTLLDALWRRGDLSTTAYLRAFDQRNNSLAAGIALQQKTQLSLIELLLHSGRLQSSPTQGGDPR